MSRRKSSFWKSFYILTRNALLITHTYQQKIDFRIACEFGHSATYSQQTGLFSRVSPCLLCQEMHPTTIQTNSLENERMEKYITFVFDMFPFHNMYYYNFLWLSYECRCLHTLSLCIQLISSKGTTFIFKTESQHNSTDHTFSEVVHQSPGLH